jgi:hypothetical protein
VGVLLARAACRKLERPHLPLFSKLQAVMLFAIVTVALILPLDLTHQGERIGREVPFVFGLFLLPVATLLCGLATPEFEAWALALRKGTDRRGFGDEASSQGAVALMWATFLVFLYYKLHRHGFPSALRVSDGIAFAWGSWLALAMPIFLLYGSTRFPTAGARFAFGTATAAYTIFEMVALAIFLEENGLPGRHDAIARLVVELGALLAVGVPLLVALRQRRMRRAIVDGS